MMNWCMYILSMSRMIALYLLLKLALQHHYRVEERNNSTFQWRIARNKQMSFVFW